MPEPSLPSFFSFFQATARQFFFFWPLSRVPWGGVLGVPQAVVPGGNIDVAGT